MQELMCLELEDWLDFDFNDHTAFEFENVAETESHGTISDNTTSSSSSNSCVAVPRKRVYKKKNRVKARLFPRIIKRDIRRELPFMWTNTLNSYDPKILASFFKTYAVPELLGMCPRIPFNKIGEIDLRGIEEDNKFLKHESRDITIGHLWKNMGELPDLAIRIQSMQLIQSTRFEGTLIKCRTHSKATRIYEFQDDFDQDFVSNNWFQTRSYHELILAKGKKADYTIEIEIDAYMDLMVNKMNQIISVKFDPQIIRCTMLQ